LADASSGENAQTRGRWETVAHKGEVEKAMTMLKRLWNDEEGASLIEYVLIAGLISIAGWALLQTIGTNLTTIMTTTQTATGTAAG
jgi:pilus assembly protein Flp/PilA